MYNTHVMPANQSFKSGDTIGNLTVIGIGPKNPSGNIKYLCRCKCGTEKHINSGSLRRGCTTSCGCQISIKCGDRFRTHGKSKSREFFSWSGMHWRCKNDFRYTERNISVCKRWDSFELFLADMGPMPANKNSIDRINNDGNYEPKNCRWSDPKEQANNRRLARKK